MPHTGGMNDLTITRALLDDPQRVWAALTDPEQLAAWFWPPRFETEVTLDLARGYRIASPTVGMAVSGDFTVVDAPRSLVETWTWDGEDQSTLVTFTLSDSTGLTVTHEGFNTEEEVASHIVGWNDCLDRLESYLAS